MLKDSTQSRGARLVGLRFRPCPGSWALLCSLCDRPRALCCLLWCRCLSLSRSLGRLSRSLRCHLFRCLRGSIVGDAWACGRSLAPCATAHGRPSALRSAVVDRSSAM